MNNPTAVSAIRILGARGHNLQNIDVEIPTGKLTVITGVSGSGKSSLAFDTIFAEGQRRYLESISVRTQSLIRQMNRPDVEEIQGLPPTICVDQRVNTASARSTLAVTAQIYDYLRVLYARGGTAHCTSCSRPVTSQTVTQIVDRILRGPERQKLMILAPIVRNKRGAHREALDRISGHGFVRARIDGELHDLSETPTPDPGTSHSIDAVIDRIILKAGVETRLRESVELAVREADGTCIACRLVDGEWEDELFSTRFSCADCELGFAPLEPRHFSFSSATGACIACEGFGVRGVAEEVDDITVFRKAACPECHGSRLQPFASGMKFGGLTIRELTALSIDEALQVTSHWLDSTADLDREAALVAERTLPDVVNRLRCLQQCGVGYLTLNRATRTLSGGEFQRARLAACLGTGLHGACFVLDEPTSGLHPRDTHSLIGTLSQLRDTGATVIVVEHDEEFMRAADHIIDLGPGAGRDGGQLMHCGSPESFAETDCDSPTTRLLTGRLHLPRRQSQTTNTRDSIVIRNARANNLRGVTAEFPLNRLVCVTGVSGSGKSSLIIDSLLPVVQAEFSEKNVAAAAADAQCDGVDGLASLNRVVAVDNRLTGSNRRSCLATISGLWDEVRKILTHSRQAKARGYRSSRFSFNSGEGRCELCRGTGVQDVKVRLLPDTTLVCPECLGRRFNRATLDITFRGLNAAQILELRVDEAVSHFSELESIRSPLEVFQQVGLGYLTLGQPASTWSGGESQRVKLGTELTSPGHAQTLFVLDEPTSGLHAADVAHLLELLHRLVDLGHSVIVIEHNPDMISRADWVLEIGPGSGSEGGTLVAAGGPGELIDNHASLTGRYLRIRTAPGD